MLPSNEYIDLTLEASGATYIAPANGKIYWRKNANAINQYIALVKILDGNEPNEAGVAWSVAANNAIYANMEVRKGEIFRVNYTAGGSSTSDFFRFVYVEGQSSIIKY